MFFKAKQEVRHFVVVVVVVGQSWRLIEKKLPVMFHWIWSSSFRRIFSSNCWWTEVQTDGRTMDKDQSEKLTRRWAKKTRFNNYM